MRIRKTVIILVALPIAVLHWIQSHPEVEQKIRYATSREQLLDIKFKSDTQKAEYEKNKNSLFKTGQASDSEKSSNMVSK